MIFDVGYDQSLWCILKGNKKKRRKIIEFINELPEEFINMVKEGIKKYKLLNNEGVFEKILDDDFDLEIDERSNVRGDFKTSDGVLYFYDIDEEGILYLSKDVLNGKSYETVIEVKLSPEGVKEFSEFENYEGLELGYAVTKITYISDTLIKSNDSEYGLVKTPIGPILTVSHSLFGGRYIVDLGRRINLNDIPEDITKEKLEVKRKKITM